MPYLWNTKLCLNILKRWVIKLHYQENGILECTKMNTERNRGFDSTYGHLGGGIGYFDHALAGRLDWHRNGEILYEDGYSTTLIADEAIRIIKNKDSSNPLFLYVAFNAPHTPIEAENNVINELLNIKNEKERKYAANIISLDREIGKIINTIESEGILEETIIIFFSDNGPVFDVNPIAATIAPDILDSKGNTLGLKGSRDQHMKVE